VWDALSKEKNPKVFFICSTSYIEAGESQMRKGDKGMKVFGVIMLLLIIDSRI
jgi:hypothetical protein